MPGSANGARAQLASHLSPLPILFGLVWPRTGVPQGAISPQDWSEIAAVARQHRLRPLLHCRSREGDWPVPPELAAEWAAAYRRAELKALRQKVDLVRITRWLAEAGIEQHVLKGGAIAWRDWLAPPVRPMRDLDILVPAEHADAAQKLLIDKGFLGREARLIAKSKDLPPLLAPKSGTVVEIHTGLFDAPTPEWVRREQAFGALARARGQALPSCSGGCRVFSDEDTLLHVIAHAVLDNQFNSGPLLLIDMQSLIACGAIDWTRFWATAEEIGALPAARLALRLAETVIPELAIDWQQHTAQDIAPAIIASAAQLMLIPIDQQTELGFVGRLARYRWRERPRVLLDSILRWRAVRKDARTLGVHHGQAGSGASLSRKLANAGSAAGRHHIGQSLDVARWLRQ